MATKTRRAAGLTIALAAAVSLVGIASAQPTAADAASGQFSSPLDTNVIGNHLPGQDFLADRNGHPHNGTDYSPSQLGVAGDPVYSIADGTVLRTGTGNGNADSATIPFTSGHGVVVDHGVVDGDRLYSYYGHLHSIDVSQGQSVQAGQQVGTMGGTGAGGAEVFAVHLHLSIFVNTDRPIAAPGDPGFVNPETFLSARGITPGTTPPLQPGDPDPGGTWPDAALPVTSSHTSDSHAAWVRLLGDVGYNDASLTVNFQRWLTDRGYYSGAIDGDFGPMTATALQELLADRGFYTGAIDGDRGPMTIQAEIRFLNDQRRFY